MAWTSLLWHSSQSGLEEVIIGGWTVGGMYQLIKEKYLSAEACEISS